MKLRSLIFVSFLTVAITISFIFPSIAFGNTPGEPGYVPPNNIQPNGDRPIKFDCLIGDAIIRVPDQWWSPSRGLVTMLNPTAGNNCLNR